MMSLQKLLDSDVSMAQNYVATLVARIKGGEKCSLCTGEEYGVFVARSAPMEDVYGLNFLLVKQPDRNVRVMLEDEKRGLAGVAYKCSVEESAILSEWIMGQVARAQSALSL